MISSTLESCLLTSLGTIKGQILLAAVSGGADSTAMLAGLAALRKEAGFALHCIHVEHGIRPAEESRGDAMAVEALCETFSVPCRVVTIPEGRIAAFAGKGGPGIEGAARIFRHKAWNLERRRIGAERILTAHTLDDLLENLLMGILRGAGPAGLSPMPRSRGIILRPLLDMTRQQVLEYLEEKDIPYRTDSTNTDTRFFRNRVRHILVPLLDSSFPSWRKTILTLAETQALTAEFLASESGKRLPWKNEDALLKLREEDFLNAPPILREEAVFAAVDILTALKPGKKSRRLVPRRSVVRSAAENSAQDLGPVRLERKNGFITMALQTQSERGFSLLIKEPGLYTLKGKVLSLGKGTALSIKVQAKEAETGEAQVKEGSVFSGRLPTVLRKHREGDRILRGGHKRRLSDIIDKGSRSGCKAVITACDAEGPSAFIAIGRKPESPGSGLLVIAGDEAKPGAERAGNSFSFELGGLDV